MKRAVGFEGTVYVFTFVGLNVHNILKMLSPTNVKTYTVPATTVFLILITSSFGHAGIVNVQSVLATEAEPGISGGLKLSADWRTGNTDLLVLGAAPVARYRAGDHLLIAIVSGEFGRSRGERIIAKTFEHLRYRHAFTDRLGAEVFGQHAFDQFRRISLRALVGGGPRVIVIDRKRGQLSAGAAYMLEYERLREGDTADAGDTQLNHRASLYVTGNYELDAKIQVVETLYVQPRLNGLRDVRLLNETQLVVNLTETIALTTAFTLSFDSKPPETIEKLDTALKSALVVHF